MNILDQVFWLEKQEVTLKDLQASGFILDIGGGGEGIMGQLKPGQSIAIDISRQELEDAAPGALKIVMDARDLKFLDGAFNTITACFTLMFMQEADQRRVFEEVFRVLAPGGRFLIWDAQLSPRPADVPAGQDIVAFNLTVHLPEKDIETGYGTLWPPRDHDVTYYAHLAQDTGFEVTAHQQQDQTFFLEVHKP